MISLLGALLLVPAVEIELEDLPPLVVQVPAGWVYSVEQRGIGPGWLHVLFTANNTGDEDLLLTADVTESGSGRRTSYGPQSFADQLRPGTVYVELALVGRGIGFIGSELQMYQLAPEEGPEFQLASLPDSVTYEDEKCVVHSVRFTKWAQDWSAKLVSRHPATADAVARGLAILRSVQFPDAPITTADQAIEAALAALPDEARVRREDLDICEKPGYDHHVTSSMDVRGFTIRFTATKPGESPRTTTCFVTFDGSVTVE